ncbi:hypothetical protein ABI_39250 [Asticcacaulis biprosthecium C19]|uniref:Uncharacterized protein n=1 Tax=Asticcacaulis biprosthecium C19 TaxID=715226 RepID=F4QRZ0_9CAUL|nr:hypothetical protein [Asticcacaulis biprosthecium]EGF89510.1 hypothetical protein ABI_39250 [Asticcacaulis biprosthecium C19]
MSDPKPLLSEKQRRKQALQKALRENLRRRKTAAVASPAPDHENTTAPDGETS